MWNELILAVSGVASAGLVYAAWRVDRERLYSAILLFLILISLLGGKIVEFFGFATNTGNIFYASIFLATYFLIERYGKREGIRSIWIGLAGIVFFSFLLKLSLLYIDAPSTAALGAALNEAFAPVSRLALASLVGYAASQTLNVYLYIYLKRAFEDGSLWLRANIANASAQLLDSVIFFTIAFWGIVPPENINEVILTGFLIKVLFMMAAAPLLYLNTMEEEEEAGYTSISFR